MPRGMRRLLLPLLMLGALAPAAALAGAAAKASWAQPQIAVVTARGLMGGRAATFRPDAPLTHPALERLVADLADTKNSALPAPNEPATIAELDAALVRGLGLGDAAAAFATTARAAGLKPPARFGTEVVARLLGLRTNHQRDGTRSSCSPPTRHPRGGRLLGCARPLDGGSGGRTRARRGAGLRATGLDPVAGPHPPHRRLADRLSLRLGRHERCGSGAVRLAGAGRLRLLGLRLARLQASAVRRCDRTGTGDSRPHDDADERGGCETRAARNRGP